MGEIATIATADVLGRLPEVVPWGDGIVADAEIDLLVCCAGFEQRSTAVAQDLQHLKVNAVFVVLYPTNVADNAPAIKVFQNVDSWSGRIELQYGRENFLHTIREELQRWRSANTVRIVVDISGMGSYVLYRVLSAVWEVLPQAKLSVYYAEAADYSPSRKEWDEFFRTVPIAGDILAIAECYEQSHFQTRGVDVIYESDVFPGENIGPLATEIVAVPNFSLERMKSMLAWAESQYNVRTSGIRWFLGQPPDSARNGWRFDALASLYNVRNEGVGVSTLDYREVLHRLDVLWEKLHTERHLVVANLGSKMQHLGCFLFLSMHNECGLLLCEPREFIASRYSTGIGSRWWLDFGRVADLKQVLESRGELRFTWS
jgi:hypothetical protein